MLVWKLVRLHKRKDYPSLIENQSLVIKNNIPLKTQALPESTSGNPSKQRLENMIDNVPPSPEILRNAQKEREILTPILDVSMVDESRANYLLQPRSIAGFFKSNGKSYEALTRLFPSAKLSWLFAH